MLKAQAAPRLPKPRARPHRAGASAVAANTTTAPFSTLVGSTLIGDTYHFTDDPIPLEGARRMLAAGSTAFKFRLSPLLPPDVEPKAAAKGGAGGRRFVGSLLEAATHPAMGYADIFDLPFAHFVFWAYPVNNTNAYQEFFDLASHLITKYAGSGKSFMVGHWEGDWAIREGYRDPVVPARVGHFRRQLSGEFGSWLVEGGRGKRADVCFVCWREGGGRQSICACKRPRIAAAAGPSTLHATKPTLPPLAKT